ncbi:Two pore calcium channel protein [Seminavis robusta]|uniref:Two pore calcium channel protein n=1 Tax=Seminavis robusta TaxID=568900 RepID=A0A9N8HPE7_9STRA|nr:Two pore calcium channel protein [Seminavis robusta]|eukprot:Sro897_g217430.1 Two pore calcium channel protein (1190) ;mRNA; r:326-4420
MSSARYGSSELPPPPPPMGPPGSTSSIESPGPSHHTWNSLMSDITMSEDEEGHNHQHQSNHRNYRPSEATEDSAASLLEYSQSSEEAYTHKREGTSSSSLLGSALSGGTSNFRFRDDLTSSSRVVRLPSQGEDNNKGNRPHQYQQQQMQAVEEGTSLLPTEKLSSDNNHQRRHRKHPPHHHKQRGGGAPVNRSTFLSTPNRWVAQLAYSFRTPPAPKQRKQAMNIDEAAGEFQQRGSEASAHTATKSKGSKKGTGSRRKVAVHKGQGEHHHVAVHLNKSEASPLLPLKEDEEVFNNQTFPKKQYHHRHNVQHGHHKLFASNHVHRHPYDYISMAVAFLKDYEAARPPTLAPNISIITPWHMGLYRLKYSTLYSLLIASATVALFLSSALEGPSPTDSNIRMHTLSGLNIYALVIFGTDMWIRCQFLKAQRAARKVKSSNNGSSGSRHQMMRGLPPIQTRTSQASLLMRPLCLFGLFLGLENLGWLIARPDRTFVVLYSSIWKPIVLYYISSQARHAMEALLRIARIVTKVLFIELVLILSFAAVAVRLFGSDFESFRHLSVAWLSLFKLSTTVVNPSIWMPMYQSTRWSAIYFVLFIIVTLFYMHSLVLSVVFQTYIQAASEIHDRSVTDRENALQLAYTALTKQHQQDARKRKGALQKSQTEDSQLSQQPGIPMYLVREALESLRPHYSTPKINALVEMFDTANVSDVDYSTFRTKIRQALSARIRTVRIASPLAVSIELLAVVVAGVNFVYVILLTSDFSAQWFDAIELELGAVITVAGLAELLMRANPLRLPNFTPLKRFNSAFDGLAIVAGLISSVGVGLAFVDRSEALEYILMGRAMDMVRVMRFFRIFRDVVRRSADVLPAMSGPVTLVLTMLHIFVYIGMAFWGGAIEIGEHGDQITPLYDLNNFNSYHEGLVTMFQIMVVNDWHAIAEVFLYAKRCASPRIVYPFFVIGNLVGVSILLNVITAFFVEAFVTKLSGHDRNVERAPQSARDFSIRTSENSTFRRISSSHNLSSHNLSSLGGEDYDAAHDADSEGSSDSSELFEFDVYEREGYDRIIQTVSGVDSRDDFARQVASHFELFEGLTPGRERVGYLVCCQQTLNRYGNRRFETDAADFVAKMELHALVSNMHGELLVLSSRETFDHRSLVRMIPHRTDPSRKLEVSATILRRHPALSLFASRVISGD